MTGRNVAVQALDADSPKKYDALKIQADGMRRPPNKTIEASDLITNIQHGRFADSDLHGLVFVVPVADQAPAGSLWLHAVKLAAPSANRVEYLPHSTLKYRSTFRETGVAPLQEIAGHVLSGLRPHQKRFVAALRSFRRFGPDGTGVRKAFVAARTYERAIMQLGTPKMGG